MVGLGLRGLAVLCDESVFAGRDSRAGKHSSMRGCKARPQQVWEQTLFPPPASCVFSDLSSKEGFAEWTISRRASGFNLASGAQVCLLSQPHLHAQEGVEGCGGGGDTVSSSRWDAGGA